jgi:hypothetical protein
MRVSEMNMKLPPSDELTRVLRSGVLAVLVLGGALGVGACNRHEDPAETAKDMSEARREGTENVQDAAQDAAENRAEGESAKEAVTDAYKVESEKIHADYEVAKQRCDGVAGADKEKCRKDADTAYESAMDALKSKRDSATGDEAATTVPPSEPVPSPIGPP